MLAAFVASPAFGEQAASSLAIGTMAIAPTNDPDLVEQWGLEAIGAFKAWESARAEGRVSVAVIDNGFLVDHEDLKDNVVATYNAVTGSADPAAVAPFSSGDSTWHGTHVCGIIAARANNAKGVAGVSYNAKLLPIKAYTSSTEASSADIVKAFDYILAHAEEYNIKVVNFSGGHKLDGSDPDDDRVVEKIQQAYDAGILTVCAAGNGAESGPYLSFPGDLSDVALNVISLREDASASGGTSPAYTRAEDSNYNFPGQTTKDLAAPGSNIYSTALLSGRLDWYRWASGTSMAAPCVAGTAALVYAANGKATASEVADILCRTATDLGAEGYDAEYGYGMVNADAAVQAALASVDVSQADVTLSADTFTYDGSPKTPAVSVRLGDRELACGTDFTIDYASNVNAGTARAIVRGIGDCHGVLEVPFNIVPATIEGFEVNGVPAYRYRTGGAIEPAVEVVHDGVLLEEGDEYRVSYADNVAAGTASIVLAGCGNYQGIIRRTFSIIEKPGWAGASRMPLGSDAAWTLRNCSLKVVGGSAKCVHISGGKVHAVRAGTVKVGVFNDAGTRVATKSVKVYRIPRSLCQIRLAAHASYRLAFDASSKKNRAHVRLQKGVLGKGFRCRLIAASNGAYRIVNAKRSYALTAKVGSTGSSRVYLAKTRNGKTQRWRISVNSHNQTFFINDKTGKVLCRARGKLVSGLLTVQKRSASVNSSAFRLTF